MCIYCIGNKARMLLVRPKLTVHINRENLHKRLIDNITTTVMTVILSIRTFTNSHNKTDILL